MRAGHGSSLTISSSRFNFVSVAECACGDGLQTEEHIFWDCKRYEDQRVTTVDILSENGNKNKQTKKHRKSVTEILRLEENRIVMVSVTS
jgi:hypothetical protein